MAYCVQYDPHKREECEEVCQLFVRNVCRVYPGYAIKPKIHLLLHLPEALENFGPTAAYNTERYTLIKINVKSTSSSYNFITGASPSIPSFSNNNSVTQKIPLQPMLHVEFCILWMCNT